MAYGWSKRGLRVPHACPMRALRVTYAPSTRALRVPHACFRVPFAYPAPAPMRGTRVFYTCPTRALRVSPFGSLLEASWRPLGDLLEASWRPLGDLLEASWRPLRGLLGALERPWALLASPKSIWDLLTSASERSRPAPEDQKGPKRSPKVLPNGPQSA